MFHPEQRKFRIHYRRRLTLVMQTLGQATNNKPSLAHYSSLEGNVRTQRRVFLDLDFDIDTKTVVRRHIQGSDAFDLSAKADLKCWILSQFPKKIKELACDLNGCDDVLTDSEIEELLIDTRNEKHLVYRNARYRDERRRHCIDEFGFFTRHDAIRSENGENSDDEGWGMGDYSHYYG